MNDLSVPVPQETPLGLVYDLDIKKYHSGAGISKTGLSDLQRSPFMYWAKHLNPDRPADKERAGQLEGNLAHCAILEPDQFNKRYAIIPEDAPNRPTSRQINAKEPSTATLIAISYWKQFNADHNNATIITPAQYETAMRQGDSVRSQPQAKELLDNGQPEISAYWIDPDTGVLCRCRPDWVSQVGGGVILPDVKTCSDASPEDFARQVARKGYHMQAAYYTDGYGAAAKTLVHAFVFFAVEDQYPWASCAMTLDPDGEALGRATYQSLLQTYARCQETNTWPSYSDAIELISLPRYMMR